MDLRRNRLLVNPDNVNISEAIFQGLHKKKGI